LEMLMCMFLLFCYFSAWNMRYFGIGLFALLNSIAYFVNAVDLIGQKS
jgi:hypothetical protein